MMKDEGLNITIIGAGYFGALAVKRLSEENAGNHLTLIDSDKDRLECISGMNVRRIHEDGVRYLYEHLSSDSRMDWIIPAVPVHLAAEWCLLKLSRKRYFRTAVPEEIDSMVPNPVRGDNKDLYVSHASFRCPDNCSEPDDLCTVTRKPRKENMFDILSHIGITGYTPVVIRSYQLAPGVGGYQPNMLFNALKKIHNVRSNILFGTACRCHGVVTAMDASDFSGF